MIAHAEQGVRHQGVEDVCGADPDQRLGGGEGEAVGEYRQPRQTAALSGVEQIPGPLDDGGQGALARRGVACARQQVGASGQAGEDLPHGEGAGAGGRQFDGQGDALEAAQEHLEVRRVDHLAGPGGQGARPEEPGAGDVIQWLQTVDALRAQVQGAAGGGQHPQIRATGQERPDEVGHVLGQVLAVVQDEEGPRRGQDGAQRGARIGVGHGWAPQGVEQDPDQVGPGRDVGQGGHVHGGAAAAGRHGLGERGLADAARPGDGDQLVGAQGLEDGRHIVLAPQEVLGARLQSPAHGVLRGQGRLVGGAHRRARHSPLLAQPEAVVLVDLQGRRG